MSTAVRPANALLVGTRRESVVPPCAEPARVLVALDTATAWSRGILRGFTRVANQHGWLILHYHAATDLEWLATELSPTAAVLGPSVGGTWPAILGRCVSVGANVDLGSIGIASVFPDEQAIARQACRHLVGRGLRTVSVFRFDRAPFGIARERAFCDAAQRADVRVAPGWWSGGGALAPEQEDPRAIVSWLAQLPKPCGVFACCDAWARVVARYAAVARILVPEDIAIVGVDDDRVECELASPGLSSVAVPWSLIGQQAAQLVARGLSGIDITSRLERVSPLGVVARQSSDVLAIDDVLVRNAVLWIQSHVSERLTVPRIAEAAKSSRRRLERRFVAALGRTVAAEVRHARVEAALHLLTTTPLLLPEVACRSGFGTAALLSEEFRSELGVPPGKFRRDWCGLVRDAD